MDWGIKLSAANVPVKTASGENEIFTSKRNNFKVADAVHTTITLTGGGTDPFLDPPSTGSVTVAHGLSFIPVVKAWLKVSGVYYELPALFNEVGFFGFYTDATNLVFNGAAFVTSGSTYDLYYFISQTEAAT